MFYDYKKKQKLCINKEKNMDIIAQLEELLSKLNLPIKYYSGNFNISEKYEEEILKFENALSKVNSADDDDKTQTIQTQLQEIKPLIQENKKHILNVFDYYEKSDPKGAQEEFDCMMDAIKKYLFIATADDWVNIKTEERKWSTKLRITPGRQFFRVRQVYEKTNSIKNNADELFHIPLNKKAYTNSERFSLPGFPSLYLSTALPLAWQECGYPQKYYYSEFKYEKMAEENRNYEEELKFLALYSPREINMWGIAIEKNKFDLWINVIVRCLVLYPLVLACSFVNHEGKVSYKQEYIIPQILMQWVQRNNSIVQGISYFTCLDIEMMPNAYCAYNLAIPVMGPYDEKQYSKRLRDEFTWSMPQYFEIPLLDFNQNKMDKKLLYDYIEEIHKIYRNYYVPQKLKNYIYEIDRICVTLYQIMQNGNGSNTQMIIHILNLIESSYSQLKEQSFENVIEETGKDDNARRLEKNIEELIEKSEKCVRKFWDTDRETNGIGYIIKKYRYTTWNDVVSTFEIEILYRKTDDISELTTWLRNNHILYFTTILDEDVAREKLNKKIESVNTPVVWKFNSESLYVENVECGDYKIEGFDFRIQGEELLRKIYN